MQFQGIICYVISFMYSWNYNILGMEIKLAGGKDEYCRKDGIIEEVGVHTWLCCVSQFYRACVLDTIHFVSRLLWKKLSQRYLWSLDLFVSFLTTVSELKLYQNKS